MTDGLDLPVDRFTVLTHCEAALLDGYGPYSGDAETRWDLWYLRDSPGDGTMKPGGQVIRGKALWYACHKAEKNTLSSHFMNIKYRYVIKGGLYLQAIYEP